MKEKNEKLSEAMKGNKNALGNEGGRPSKYDPKYCQEIIDFFSREPFSIVMGQDDDGKEIVMTDKYGSPIMQACKLPTFEGFAIELGVARQTLLNWCNENPEFLDAYARAKDHQKEILVQNGLFGNYEKQFAIFTAKNVTDMTDKQQVDNVSSDGSMSPDQGRKLSDFYKDANVSTKPES